MKSNIARSQFEILKTLGERLKEVFTEEKRTLQQLAGKQPTYRPSNTKWDWPEIARFVYQNSLEVQPWVRFVCEYSGLSQPNHLKSPNIVAAYRQQFEKSQTRVLREAELDLDGYKMTAKMQLQLMIDAMDDGDITSESPEDIACMVLCDTVQPLSTLFRYCWAADLGVQPLVDRYFEAALYEYFFSPDTYDEVWGAWLPAEFVRAARRIASSI